MPLTACGLGGPANISRPTECGELFAAERNAFAGLPIPHALSPNDQSFLITIEGNLLVMSFALAATLMAILRAICL